MPAISVIIPCCNHGRYLGEAIQSVSAQTFTDWECIVVNDGSVDNTKAVALSFAHGDGRVRYYEQTHKGPSAARNLGLDHAMGEYIQFLDADDLLFPEKLATQVALLAKNDGPAIAYCDYLRVGPDNRPSGKYLPPRLDHARALYDVALRWETEASVPIHCFLFDARLFKSHGVRFDEALPNHEDWDCWMHMLSFKPPLHYRDEKLVVYRDTPKSLCQNPRSMRNGFVAAIRKHRRLSGDPALRAILERKERIVRAAYRRMIRARYLNRIRMAKAALRSRLDRHVLWRFN
jgi:hypothetical protein